MTQTAASDVDPTPRTSREEIDAAVARVRAGYASGRTHPLEWRKQQLAALVRMLEDNEDQLVAALAADLGRPPFEGWAMDLRLTAREIEELVSGLDSWLAPEKVKVPMLFQPARAQVVREPLGTVLVIAPWNYPIQLLVAPLAAAIAAGNTVVCKPSEVAPATSAAMARLIPEYVDPAAVAVVEGGVDETTALLDRPWDHILYTGNGTVGRIVAASAARHLTPVTLELGGKSPVIVHSDANLKYAAARIAYGKFVNAGQTCIATDHLWVHRDVADELLRLVEDEITDRYGADPRSSKDFGRIVNSRHTQRIRTLLDAGGYDLVCGGDVDVDARYVAPTVARVTDPGAALMGEEIFGPVLPVLVYDDLDEPIKAIVSGDKPLALYVFTSSDEVADRLRDETSSGGFCVNDVMLHVGVSNLPFGGVGASGYGAYHGRWGVETFSHRKAVLRKPSRSIDAPILRPPYKPWKKWLTKKVF